MTSSRQGRATMLSVLFRILLVLVGVRAQSVTSDSSQGVCTVKGRVFTQRNWYGYLVHKAFQREYAKIQYQITYPVKECCANLLIYYDDQVKQLRSSMTCEERLAVLPPDNNQVISLRASNDSSGCTLWNETGEAFYVCLGERIFRSSVARTWFFAISRCDKTGPLNLNYVFNITGYYGECEDDPLAPSSGWNSYVGYLDNNQESSSSEDVYKYLSISLGILAGLGLILAAVFFGLWFVGMKNAAKTKGSSVTSSQATMTQDDIFYVNPSLSDREQAEYSQSGSENYYEVIPERRSYESINTGLANGGVHMRTLRSVHGSIGHNHPHGHHHPHGHLHYPHQAHMTQAKEVANVRGVPYVFEDYPPPPYQPPRLLGLQKNNGLGLPPGHSHTLTQPMGQRQRPTLVHHAYHSSLVPTSAALGNGGMSGGGAATSNNGMSGIMSLNSVNSSGNLMNTSNNGGNNNNNSLLFNNPGLTMNIQSVPNNLATFSSGPTGSGMPSQGGGAINLQSLVNHQMMSLQSHPSSSGGQAISSGGPLNSLAAALNSSHGLVSTSGQSETSA